MHLQNVGNHASDYKTSYLRTLPLPNIWAKFNTDPTCSIWWKEALNSLIYSSVWIACMPADVS